MDAGRGVVLTGKIADLTLTNGKKIPLCKMHRLAIFIEYVRAW